MLVQGRFVLIFTDMKVSQGDVNGWIWLAGFNLEKSVGRTFIAQALDAPGKFKNLLITNKVVENCACIFYIPTIHGDSYAFFEFTMHIKRLHFKRTFN